MTVRRPARVHFAIFCRMMGQDVGTAIKNERKKTKRSKRLKFPFHFFSTHFVFAFVHKRNGNETRKQIP